MLYIETQMSQIDSPLPLFEAASDIYLTIAEQNKEALAYVGVSNFLLPNEAGMRNLAHSYDFTCERLEGIYTRDYSSRGVFKLKPSPSATEGGGPFSRGEVEKKNRLAAMISRRVGSQKITELWA